MPRNRAWEAPESLTELTPYADWDAVTSMVASLRMHLFEYGTIPTWNFMFCGGRPELSIPYSWAWTWPSLFAYAFAPVHAVLAVWAVMTLVGFLSTRALLRRWSASAAGASVGAALYVLNGFFAAHFNAGHVTFAFFHLVPVLMLLFEWGFDRALAGERRLAPSLLTTLVAFLLATAGLPHTVLYFSPVFLLLVAFRLGLTARRAGALLAVRAAAAPLVANVLGVWLAAYKLWPAMRWQLDSPRPDVRVEAYDVLTVVMNTLTFVEHYFDAADRQPWHVYPPWGYNAFLGPLPWLLAGVAVVALARRGLRGRARDASAYGLLLVAVGILLSLGNGTPLAPGYWFLDLPVLSGTRAFMRYQVVIVFGLAIVTAQALGWLGARLAPGAPRRLAVAVVSIGVLVPVLVQTGVLVWNLGAVPKSVVARLYGLDAPSGPPTLAWRTWVPLRGSGHQTGLLEGGVWIANCRSDIALPGLDPQLGEGKRSPLSFPAPVRLAALGRNRIELVYAKHERQEVQLNLRVLEGFEVTGGPARQLEGRTWFDPRGLEEPRLTLRASYPGPFAGACASGVGLLVAFGFFWYLARRSTPAACEPAGAD